MKMNKRLRVCLLVVLGGVMLFSGWKAARILRSYAQNRRTYSAAEAEFVVPAQAARAEKTAQTRSPAARAETEDAEPADEETPPEPFAPISINFELLHSEYPNVTAWIYQPDTVISYPVMPGDANYFYINHLYNDEYNPGGSIFLDKANQTDYTDPHVILYGHHMKDGSMFAALEQYKKQEWYDEHPELWLLTPDGDYRLTVFAAYVTIADSYVYQTFADFGDAYTAWQERVCAAGGIETGIVPSTEDRVVTLSTCSYEYDDARMVVHCIMESP